MPRVTTGNSATFTLGAYSTLTLNPGASAVAEVTFESSVESVVPSFTANAQSRSFGPYIVPMAVTLEVSAGQVLYTVAESSIAQEQRVAQGANQNFHNTTFELQYSGAFGALGTDNVSRRMIVELPDLTGVYAIAIRIHNADDAEVIYKANWRTSDSIGDAVWSGESDWQDFTKNGSGDITAPAEASITSQVNAPDTYEIPGLVVSDPILTARLGKYLGIGTFAADWHTHANSVITFTAGPEGTLLTHGITAFSQAGVDAIATPEALDTPVYQNRLPPVSIICYTEHEVHSVLFLGGSTDNGNDDDPTEAPAPGAGTGWMNRAFFASFADGGKRVVFANACDDNGSTEFFLGHLEAILASDNDFNEICYRFTGGDDTDDADYVAGMAAGTEAGWIPYESRIKGQALRAIKLCSQHRKSCRLAINRYRNAVTGHEYAMLKRLTAWARDMAARNRCLLDDGPEQFNNEDAASGSFKNTAFMEGGTGPHFNGSGQYHKANLMIDLIRANR